MAPDQYDALIAYVDDYLRYERSRLHTHATAERRDLDTDVRIFQDRALALGVSLEALQEAVAMALPETTSKPLRAE